MKLEDVTMEIRPRTDWEAVDSGFALVRRDFWRCWLLWWLSLAPVWLLIYPLQNWPWIWLLLMLWAKWVGCRMILHQLSRRLFGEQPTWSSLWREMPRAWWRRFFYRMILARFSPWKPLSAAVEELEGLRGGKYRIRMSMIARKGEGIAILLTAASCVATAWLTLALLFTGLLFFPESVQDRWWSMIDAGLVWEQHSFVWLLLACVTVACSLVDGWITGAGFGLYVNSRTWTEGWDIELAFKRIANRLRQPFFVWIGLILLMSTLRMSAERVDGGLSSREAIEDIKKQDDFLIHKEKYRVTPTSASLPSSPIPGFAYFLNVLGYMILALFVLVLLAGAGWLFYHSRWLRPRLSQKVVSIGKACVVMGMEVSADSLPVDLIATADALWKSGDRTRALGLLYRGSLAWWIHQAGVGIRECDTEGDCLVRVHELQHAYGSYFQTLTEAWLLGAYAQMFPSQNHWSELCGQWPFAERSLS